ncbi:hypothetical protein BGX31_008201 [Mortierella sp. GBA43]|nr:hypothetical protein BGX31_008201 [Mortierella sp. GBA43]
MATTSRNGRSDQLSSAELGQGRSSLDEDVNTTDRTALLGKQRHPSQGSTSPSYPSNNINSNGNKRPTKTSISGHARRRIIIALTSISGVLLVILGIALYKKIGSAPTIERSTPSLITAKYGAVAAEEIHCSEIGVQVLKDGGNAVDAAIASCLCVGTVNMFSAGIGGGGFMTIRASNGSVEVIDFRESAPAGARPTMYKKDPMLAQKGGLSVAVPGEIRGLELAHKRHGKLPWERLFAPSVKLARDGWAIGPELAKRLQVYKTMMESEPDWSVVFAPNGTVLREGQRIKRPALANTLETIGKEGSEAFYTGQIAQNLVDYVQKNGGILTMRDMETYKPIIKEPLVGYYQGRKVYTTPAPTSGPILISILNILERYNLGRFKEDSEIEAHRLVEAMKFGYAQRTQLGDPAFTDLEDRIRDILSKDTAGHIRANISDERTFPVEYYNPQWEAIENHGTTHLSSVDKDNMAVALTSTVNLVFGSKLIDPKTGIILNDEMDDFSIPGTPNAFGLRPSPFNYPEPGKRPLSSCVPTIVERDGQFELALGGSGGSRILTSVLQVILNIYNHNYNVMEAVEAPRVHHQLMPNVVDIESGYDLLEVDFLETRGHNVTVSDILLAKAEVQAVMRDMNGLVYAASDSRKHGIAAGY